jgi:hypothetical protein
MLNKLTQKSSDFLKHNSEKQRFLAQACMGMQKLQCYGKEKNRNSA